MAIQDPPVCLDKKKRKSGDAQNTQEYRAYTQSGKFIEYIVWPVLYLSEDGGVLCKGVAQFRKSPTTSVYTRNSDTVPSEKQPLSATLPDMSTELIPQQVGKNTSSDPRTYTSKLPSNFQTGSVIKREGAKAENGTYPADMNPTNTKPVVSTSGQQKITSIQVIRQADTCIAGSPGPQSGRPPPANDSKAESKSPEPSKADSQSPEMKSSIRL